MHPPFLLITGIPRSGTTLAASLVDRLQNTICVNEPGRYYNWTGGCQDSKQFARLCMWDLERMRRRVIAGGTVLDRREHDGSVPTNYFDETGPRRDLRMLSVGRPGANEELLMAIKHNEPFTSVLSELCSINEVRIVALIRHPIPTILSWQARGIPLSTGQLSAGYRFWPEALAIRDAGKSVLEVQAKMYELYCTRYLENRDRIAIVKYEDLIADPGIFERFTGRALCGGPRIIKANLTRRNHLEENIARVKNAIAENLRNAFAFYPDLNTWRIATH